MQIELLIEHVVNWLNNYCERSGFDGFIVGVSGGIDSAVTSVLCAKTTKSTVVISMPILQDLNKEDRALCHMKWLEKNFTSVTSMNIDLTSVFNAFQNIFPDHNNKNTLCMANSRARIRMTMLYALASNRNMLVVGTGNKVEDFGIGFYTKYGDGGVDISPIAGLMKSHIYAIGHAVGISENIIKAPPTDGLWDDGRSDENQIGATYDELEKTMKFLSENGKEYGLEDRAKHVLKIYKDLRRKNLHKMKPIPVCPIPERFL